MHGKILLIILLAFACRTTAQTDTFRIATYNLLHYGRPAANRHTLKNSYLRPVLAAIKPAIICFNEIDTTMPGMQDTLYHVMPYPMLHGPEHNTRHTDVTDGLYWQPGKFRLLRDTVISTHVRDIVAYDLLYNDPLTGISHDTIKLKVITAHFKSSNTVADRNLRAAEAKNVSDYLSALHENANYIMLGDFNLYKSSETAYQHLVAPADTFARLNDPLNQPGNWDGSAAFAAIHTQSPRSTQLPDQGATGGLDSRFDFILVSDAILHGWKGLKYIPETYTAFGNDGCHFKKALTDTPAHPVLSAGLTEALYRCSDHLPVFADIAITPVLLPSTIVSGIIQEQVHITNPFTTHIYYRIRPGSSLLSYRLLSIQGAIIQSGILDAANSALPITSDLLPGLYFLQVNDQQGHFFIRKLVHP